MTTFIADKIVDITAIENVLRERLDGMSFDDKQEVTQFIDEIVCDLVEMPAYDASNINFDEGGDIYDVLDNVDELRDLQNSLIAELF